MTPARIIILFFVTLFFACKQDKEDEEFSASVVLEYPNYFGTPDLPNDRELTNATVELGRFLFYDPILSSDQSISCASCHKQEFAFSDNKTLSEGVDNNLTGRHSMAIFNTIWQERFFWDGRAASLEEQALQPIENPSEMNLTITEALSRLNNSSFYLEKFKSAFNVDIITKEHLAIAISDFERTLLSTNSKYDRAKKGLTALTEQEARGEALFMNHPIPGELRGANCGDCHAFPHLMDNRFSNNGLDASNTDIGFEEVTGKSTDKGKFKVPNLRNIGFTAPYMHDGRFATLEEVLDHYNEHIQFSNPTLDPLIINGSNDCNGCQLGLTEDEKKDLLAFLKTLDDDEFIRNENFSDPF